MLTGLYTMEKVVGAKQVKRALRDGRARRVFLAADADPRVTQPIEELCRVNGIPTQQVDRMKDLGQVCGIGVGAAVVACL